MSKICSVVNAVSPGSKPRAPQPLVLQLFCLIHYRWRTWVSIRPGQKCNIIGQWHGGQPPWAVIWVEILFIQVALASPGSTSYLVLALSSIKKVTPSVIISRWCSSPLLSSLASLSQSVGTIFCLTAARSAVSVLLGCPVIALCAVESRAIIPRGQ